MPEIEITWKSRYLSEIKAGKLSTKVSAKGDRILRYYIDFHHTGLNAHKEVSAPELPILQNKVNALMASWDAKRDALLKKEKIQAGKESAEQLTVDALEKLENVDNFLLHTLSINDAIDWSTLRDHSKCPEPKPKLQMSSLPKFSEPKISFIDWIFGQAKKKQDAAQLEHSHAIAAWKIDKQKAEENHHIAVAKWEERRSQFLELQSQTNAKVDELEAAVSNGAGPDLKNGVIEHISIVLDASEYFDIFEKSYVLDYDEEEKLLLIEYELPSPDRMPSVKAVKFVQSTSELKETQLSERDKKSSFDAACYKICLRTMHEVFEADIYNNISKILFNGFSTAIDKATGKEVRACILSVLVDRSEFCEIDLSNVDPKACFKSLKGVSAASLAALAPIEPVMKMNKDDRRFVASRDATSELSIETNLAAMDWEDFEHLVRELFEAEFRSRGGEVKITRASSDGGVDAVAFDPDPITGGKIVIQAKRYTKTVGVAAVRDLYGTTINEGAARGILVTTADYGSDAYKFAADKPITLLTGSNLLHMLEKHGFRAKIDLVEARKQLGLTTP